jgi:hypothetical protein
MHQLCKPLLFMCSCSQESQLQAGILTLCATRSAREFLLLGIRVKHSHVHQGRAGLRSLLKHSSIHVRHACCTHVSTACSVGPVRRLRPPVVERRWRVSFNNGTGTQRSDKLSGTLVEVASGDCVVVRDAAGKEHRLNLSSLRAPRMGRRGDIPEPWASEAKEFLRSRCHGDAGAALVLPGACGPWGSGFKE